MASKLFEYAVLYHPKVRRDAQGNEVQGGDELLVDVTRRLGANEKEIGMRASREIPEAYLDKLDDVEIIVRPF